MSIPASSITGLILAGGLGSRMGGADKGLQQLDGLPMAAQVLSRLQPQVGTVLINANRHVDDYAKLGAPVISDVIEGYAGPLAGIHAGLSHCDTDHLVSVPCDSPRLPADLVARLSDALLAHHADAAVAVTVNHHHQQRHPVFLLLRTTLRDSLSTYLNQGGRKVDTWLTSLNCIEAMFDDDSAFMNINTREELQALTRR